MFYLFVLTQFLNRDPLLLELL